MRGKRLRSDGQCVRSSLCFRRRICGNCLAKPVRRDGESFNARLKRLDKGIGLAWSNDVFIDEVKNGKSDLL